MSPVVLHKLPVFGPQRHGAFTPQLQMLNTMERPDCANASRNFAYCTSGSRPSALHQSKFRDALDRKSTRLNSSHLVISYAVFCVKKKKAASRSAQILTHT